MRERLAILNAYPVPEPVREKLYRQISPVNSFRPILNYFLAPTSSHCRIAATLTLDTPYDFLDVSAV